MTDSLNDYINVQMVNAQMVNKKRTVIETVRFCDPAGQIC